MYIELLFQLIVVLKGLLVKGNSIEHLHNSDIVMLFYVLDLPVGAVFNPEPSLDEPVEVQTESLSITKQSTYVTTTEDLHTTDGTICFLKKLTKGCFQYHKVTIKNITEINCFQQT